MRSPCLNCDLIDQDKNNPTCVQCPDRIQFNRAFRGYVIQSPKKEVIVSEPKKICKGECGLLKPLSDYTECENARDGHEGTCKKCRSAMNKRRQEEKKKMVQQATSEKVEQVAPGPFDDKPGTAYLEPRTSDGF